MGSRFETEADYQRYMASRWNTKPGKLEGLDCNKCLNRGFYYEYSDKMETIVQIPCPCMARREAQRRMERSGISKAMERMTFESFEVRDKWQEAFKNQAVAFAKNPNGWFFAGGQVGGGKTHLCTAILRELSKKYEVSYILWRDECAKIKASLNDAAGVERMNRLKNVKVLYIDDLFKGSEMPTQGDLNIAFELYNYRYNNDELITITSSERLIGELVDIDEAIGSRIAEKSKGNIVQIARSKDRNWRLRL